MEFQSVVSVCSGRSFVELPVRAFPTVESAQARLDEAVARLEHLRRGQAPRPEVRTAECDWFGAEEMLTLARAYAAGRVAQVARESLPAEVQVIRVGPLFFVGWPAETFVDFALELKSSRPGVQLITLANGELQGYLVTQEAVDGGGYEASNALFESPKSARLLMQASLQLLRDLPESGLS